MNSSAFAYALDPAVSQAQAYSAAMGHNVIVHYPDLPKFGEYQGGKGSWSSARRGTDGWTGYGWEGEGTKLPDKDGLTFGAPMPKGQELSKAGSVSGGGAGALPSGGGDGGGKSRSKSKSKSKKKDTDEGADGEGGGGGNDAE
ncbi:hypothetical protein BD324DRAFT_620656 [Kockovaella imperatae]|uniref:Uncharacterized protein n=1 Tax=Kockovaella imperatae TaxID=4999 RepID=A0A1Y1UK14_9TREE|nr:hypothetical protein BD324DRAFT_620656 [Kockovaella imperatae]ORX38388.1 hypothetical protein BD324DRAFT_620656 [Kockovaella imperatae]